MKKVLIVLASCILGLSSCSKKEVNPHKKITYKFYNSRVPYDIVYYSTTEVRQSVSSKSFEITVDFDKAYINKTSGVWSLPSDTTKVYIESEGKIAQKEIVSGFKTLVGFNYNALK